MKDDTKRRELLNLRALRVSYASARKGLAPDRYPALHERANALLQTVRQRTTDPDVLREVDALQAEWDRPTTLRESDSG